MYINFLGRDTLGDEAETTEAQVQRLIVEATEHKNLSQGYVMASFLILLDR